MRKYVLSLSTNRIKKHNRVGGDKGLTFCLTVLTFDVIMTSMLSRGLSPQWG